MISKLVDIILTLLLIVCIVVACTFVWGVGTTLLNKLPEKRPALDTVIIWNDSTVIQCDSIAGSQVGHYDDDTVHYLEDEQVTKEDGETYMKPTK